MICPKCKADIPDDSWFCDQCGSELKFCPNCLVPAKGKRCTRCGAVLVSASALNKNVSSNPPVSPGPVSQQASITDSPCTKSDSATMRPETSSGPHIPDTEPTRLVMMDCPSKIVLLKDKAIIGRTKGDYLNVFSNQPYKLFCILLFSYLCQIVFIFYIIFYIYWIIPITDPIQNFNKIV